MMPYLLVLPIIGHGEIKYVSRTVIIPFQPVPGLVINGSFGSAIIESLEYDELTGQLTLFAEANEDVNTDIEYGTGAATCDSVIEEHMILGWTPWNPR